MSKPVPPDEVLARDSHRGSVALAGLATVALVLAACGLESPGGSGGATAASAQSTYVTMKPDLAELKRDFNATKGAVRLLYLVGPTCGICLRGMADLDRELHSKQRNNPNLQTLVVYQPTLGATRDHVAPAMALLQGPQIRHYWEETGIIGNLYAETLGLKRGEDLIYAWDVWMIYGPDAQWDGEFPPAPQFTMHQLSGVADSFDIPYLDAEVFSENALAALGSRGPGPHSPAAAVATSARAIPEIAQPVSVAVRQHLIGRGGYQNYLTISQESFRGGLVRGSQSYPVKLTIARDGSKKRMITTGKGTAELEISAGRVSAAGPVFNIAREDSESAWLRAFDFVSPLMDWKDKGHELSEKMNMERVGESLAWVLDLRHREGSRWKILIDSHTGYELERRMLGDKSEVLLIVALSDYRPLTDYPLRQEMVLTEHRYPPETLRHFVYPHRMTWRGPHGEVWAEARFDEIELRQATSRLSN